MVVLVLVFFRLLVAFLMHQEEKTGKDTAQCWASSICIEIVRQPLVGVV